MNKPPESASQEVTPEQPTENETPAYWDMTGEQLARIIFETEGAQEKLEHIAD